MSYIIHAQAPHRLPANMPLCDVSHSLPTYHCALTEAAAVVCLCRDSSHTWYTGCRGSGCTRCTRSGCATEAVAIFGIWAVAAVQRQPPYAVYTQWLLYTGSGWLCTKVCGGCVVVCSGWLCTKVCTYIYSQWLLYRGSGRMWCIGGGCSTEAVAGYI